MNKQSLFFSSPTPSLSSPKRTGTGKLLMTLLWIFEPAVQGQGQCRASSSSFASQGQWREAGYSKLKGHARTVSMSIFLIRNEYSFGTEWSLLERNIRPAASSVAHRLPPWMGFRNIPRRPAVGPVYIFIPAASDAACAPAAPPGAGPYIPS